MAQADDPRAEAGPRPDPRGQADRSPQEFRVEYGPDGDFKNAKQIVSKQSLSTENLDNNIASYKLEHSYIGIIGKSIEPAIAPLGYDWKIGIAIVTSFAAREVFVGTLATIYSVKESGNQEDTIKNKLASEMNPTTGEKLFNLASGVSLLLFYVFAMQCMSTLAITRKETNSWKWPLIQLVFMTGFAYTMALVAYQILQ